MPYYRTKVMIEVLHDVILPQDMSLSQLAYEITEGSFSGVIDWGQSEQLSAKEMAEAAILQGSDPEFFGIDEEGNKLETGSNPLATDLDG